MTVFGGRRGRHIRHSNSVHVDVIVSRRRRTPGTHEHVLRTSPSSVLCLDGHVTSELRVTRIYRGGPAKWVSESGGPVWDSHGTVEVCGAQLAATARSRYLL